MIDQRKRTTLKLAAATGAIAAIPHHSLADQPHGKIVSSPVRAFGISEVLIRISTESIQYSNLLNTRVRVRHFAPGSVRWDGHYLDLNALRKTPTLAPFASTTLATPHTVASDYSQQQADSGEIWADEAIVKDSDGAQSILLGGYFHQGQVHIFPIPAVNRTPTVFT